MQTIIDVNTGEIAVHRGSYLLQSIAIGSCIAIAAYDAKTQNAGMAHIMLPGQAPESFPEKTKYALNGISSMIDRMLLDGSALRDIEVCLVGAGNVLRKEDDTICQGNINSVITILVENEIRICASVLGGYSRKSIFLNAETGHVAYTEGNDMPKILWQSFGSNRQTATSDEYKNSLDFTQITTR